MAGSHHVVVSAEVVGEQRRRSVADDLYERLVYRNESFWKTVRRPLHNRDITRDDVRELLRRGLTDVKEDYRAVALLFNVAPEDYKRFVRFLLQYDCQLH